MVFTLVQTAKVTGTASTATLVFSPTPVVHDTLIAFVSWDSASATVTAPSGWIQADSTITVLAPNAQLACYYYPDCPATASWNFAFSGSRSFTVVGAEY